MKTFAIIAAAAGLVAATKEHAKEYGTGAVKYTTAVVTAYTTYCPSSTQITHNGVTYTVTEATTLTISNCPCTVTKPVESYVTSSTVCYKPSASSAPVKPSSYFPSVPAPSVAAPSASAPPQYTGAASKAQVAGAGLLAVFGAAVVAL